jgi:acetyl-CoA synthase
VGGDLSADLYEQQPYGMLVEVSGEEMQPYFEPVLERQLDTIFNEVDGLMHRGQRLIASLRVSKKVHANGLTLQQLGELVHASYHNEFGNVLSRVQVTFFTNQQDVETLAEKAQAVFHARDQRLQEMADEEVDTFYTCTTCQSIAGTHVCVISPEHPGVCGAVDWLDARAGVGIRPLGPNKAVQKQGEIDLRLGQWEAVNRLVQQESGGGLEAYSLYSLMQDPGPACGDFDCITAMLPLANGVMVVERSYKGMTPSGMDWEMLYEMVGGGLPVPGFIGHSKRALHRDKFISAEGGWRRIVWMNHDLREELRPALEALAAAAGLGGFVDLIATEQDTVSEEELLEKLSSVNHPALRMDPLI